VPCWTGGCGGGYLVRTNSWTYSKQLTKKKRQEFKILIEKNALAYAVAVISPERIDQINILQASIEAMKLALDKLKVLPEHIIVDGPIFSPYNEIKYTTVIKGDAKFQSIAAASILAKTYRDEIMEELHLNYPHYSWNKNKGYPTKIHRERIQTHGATDHHRKTFRLLSK
jgi:ribonuclease HII